MSTTSQTPNNLISSNLQFLITLSQSFATISRRLDHMGSMIGFTDFVILYHLASAEDTKLRRVDLADKTGLTPSGITRLLPPLEKIGLIQRESEPRDARVSYVVITPTGKEIFNEAVERAEYVTSTIMPSISRNEVSTLTDLLSEMRRKSL